jgi:hypothetical protein
MRLAQRFGCTNPQFASRKLSERRLRKQKMPGGRETAEECTPKLACAKPIRTSANEINQENAKPFHYYQPGSPEIQTHPANRNPTSIGRSPGTQLKQAPQ